MTVIEIEGKKNYFLTTSCLSVICKTSTSSSIKPLYRILLADSWSAFEYTGGERQRKREKRLEHKTRTKIMSLSWEKAFYSPSIEIACSRACTACNLFLWFEKPWASRIWVNSRVCLSFGMLYIIVSDSMISDGLSEIYETKQDVY